MLEPQRLNELAEVVADGGTPDWESAEQSTSDADTRQTIAQLRAVASVGRIFASLSAGSRTRQRRRVLSAGTSWGTLRVIEHVGRGRFGDVYRAWDPALDREVALKILCHVDGDDLADSHVIEEGRLMARVRHPNVVTIYGAQRIDGVTGLWMEFVEGRTLAAELAERGPHAEDELIRVGIELCRALAAVHEAGLLHRDVKAQNVLRAERGRIMLGDFGTGRELDVAEDMSGALAGTPAYVAPELYKRQPASTRSDIYSLGTVLFHLATRAYPVPGRSLRELRDAHAECRRTPLRPLRPDLSARLTRAIEVALDPEPTRRFDSAGVMERAFEACREVSVLRRRWAIAAVAGVLAASALLVENIQRTNTSPADTASNAARNETAPDALQAMKTSVFAPPGAKFVFHVPGSLALSPDGKMLAFAALTEDGQKPLWIHPVEGGSARQLPYTENGVRPFWSPDGKWLGFFTREGLKKIHIDGGHPQILCHRFSSPQNLEDGAWSKNGIVFFSQGYGPIYQVPASGGRCAQATALDKTKERGQHLWPSLLPDERRFLYFWIPLTRSGEVSMRDRLMCLARRLWYRHLKALITTLPATSYSLTAIGCLRHLSMRERCGSPAKPP